MLLVFPIAVFGQRKCKRFVQDSKNPNTEVKVSCECPKKQEDCLCYVGDWSDEYYNELHHTDMPNDFGVKCIGKTFFTFGNNIWSIVNVTKEVVEVDTVYTYYLSRKVERYWQIPKNRVEGFDPERWRFQSQVEQVIRGQDTIIKFEKITDKIFYVVKRQGVLSIDDVYLGSSHYLRHIDGITNDFSLYSTARKQKIFFLTGYADGEYIMVGDKDGGRPVMDFINDWQE